MILHKTISSLMVLCNFFMFFVKKGRLFVTPFFCDLKIEKPRKFNIFNRLIYYKLWWSKSLLYVHDIRFELRYLFEDILGI